MKSDYKSASSKIQFLDDFINENKQQLNLIQQSRNRGTNDTVEETYKLKDESLYKVRYDDYSSKLVGRSNEINPVLSHQSPHSPRSYKYADTIEIEDYYAKNKGVTEATDNIANMVSSKPVINQEYGYTNQRKGETHIISDDNYTSTAQLEHKYQSKYTSHNYNDALYYSRDNKGAQAVDQDYYPNIQETKDERMNLNFEYGSQQSRRQEETAFENYENYGETYEQERESDMMYYNEGYNADVGLEESSAKSRRSQSPRFEETNDKNLEFKADQIHIITQFNRELEEKNKALASELDYFRNKAEFLDNFKQEVDQRIENMLVEVEQREKLFKDTENDLLKRLANYTSENSKLSEDIKSFQKKEALHLKEIEHLSKKLRDFDLVLEENSKENTEVLKELKQDSQRLKEKLKSKENQFEIVIYFLNKMRNLYDKTKIVKNPNEDEYLTIKNLTSDTLKERLIELENFVTNMKSEYTKTEFETNKQILENMKPLNSKIDDLSTENKLLRGQIQQMLKNEEMRIKERERELERKKDKELEREREKEREKERERDTDPDNERGALEKTAKSKLKGSDKELDTSGNVNYPVNNTTPNRFKDTYNYPDNNAENVFINNYQNVREIPKHPKEKKEIVGASNDRYEDSRNGEKGSKNFISPIPEDIQRKMKNNNQSRDYDMDKSYEKPKPVKYVAQPKFEISSELKTLEQRVKDLENDIKNANSKQKDTKDLSKSKEKMVKNPKSPLSSSLMQSSSIIEHDDKKKQQPKKINKIPLR